MQEVLFCSLTPRSRSSSAVSWQPCSALLIKHSASPPHSLSLNSQIIGKRMKLFSSALRKQTLKHHLVLHPWLKSIFSQWNAMVSGSVRSYNKIKTVGEQCLQFFLTIFYTFPNPKLLCRNLCGNLWFHLAKRYRVRDLSSFFEFL